MTRIIRKIKTTSEVCATVTMTMCIIATITKSENLKKTMIGTRTSPAIKKVIGGIRKTIVSNTFVCSV